MPPSGQFPATRLNTQHHIRHPVALSTATTSISSADAIIHAALTRIPVQSAPALTPKYTAHQGHVDNFRPLPTTINSPINIEFLATCLLNYPNRNLANYLLNGFLYGFDIGYSGPVSSCRPQNLLSARNNPQVINTSINTEIQRGHTSGPFMVPPVFPLHCSPLGAVPKKDGSHRIILDLSSPRGVSINDGILKEDFTVRYTSFDDAVDLVRHLGKDCELGKMDIKHAFRLCPVSPFDWSLLGMYWNGAFYIDTRLPFGSRSSPYIFNTFADALAWILIYVFSIPYLLHYLDDFFLIARSGLQRHMSVVQHAFQLLGVPLAPNKVIGPTKCLTYLGIEIDSSAFMIRLPSEKFHELISELSSWRNRKSCTKRELLSCIGKLSFAAKVVKPGRMFLRRLITLSTSVTELNHHIYLNASARADIHWWLNFLPSWNGISLIQEEPITADTLALYTDASGTLGFGAIFDLQWFSCPWPDHFLHHHINVKELFAVLAALFTWGNAWINKQIIFLSDNEAICQIWKTGSCKDEDIMFFLRHLFCLLLTVI